MSEDVKIAKDSIEDSTVEGVRSLEADINMVLIVILSRSLRLRG